MDQSLAAVVAHGLLNSLAVVAGSMLTLGKAWDRIDCAHRDELVDLALTQAECMADGLEALPPTARHRVANNLFVLRGVVQTMKAEGAYLDAADRGRLFEVVSRQSQQASEVLEHVARALPDEVLILLDRLDSDRDRDRDRAHAHAHAAVL